MKTIELTQIYNSKKVIIDELQLQISQLDTNKYNLEVKLEQLKSDIQISSNQFDKTYNELSNAQEQLNYLQTISNDLQNKIEDLQATFSANKALFTEKLANQQLEYDSIQRQISKERHDLSLRTKLLDERDLVLRRREVLNNQKESTIRNNAALLRL